MDCRNKVSVQKSEGGRGTASAVECASCRTGVYTQRCTPSQENSTFLTSEARDCACDCHGLVRYHDEQRNAQ